METLNKIKKAQSLPLNTIVIAILVIIVLLVIIVFFTSKVGKSGEQLDTIAGCTLENPAISTLGYKNLKEETVEAKDGKCLTVDYGRVSVIPSVKVGEDKIKICCGTKTQ